MSHTTVMLSSSPASSPDTEATLDMDPDPDIPMDDATLQVHSPPGKHKRPLTHRMAGERNFTHLPTTPPSPPKAPRPYTSTSYIGPRYGDPQRFALPDHHQPSYIYDEVDPYEYAFEPRGTEHGYGCHGFNPVEPFSSYRNYNTISDPTQENSEAICRRLNCWLDTPHTHDPEEILSHLEKEKEKEQKRAEYSSTENEEEMRDCRRARKKFRRNAKGRDIRASTSTSLLESSTKSARDLVRALPCAVEIEPEGTADEANLAQLLANRPPDCTFTLAIRPAVAKREMVEVGRVADVKPRQVAEGESQELRGEEAEVKRDEGNGDEDAVD